MVARGGKRRATAQARAPACLRASRRWRRCCCDILQVSEHVQRDELRALLASKIGPETEEAIVTAGQLLIEQGFQEGFQRGERAMLLRQLRHRFGDQVDSHVEERVAKAPIERIETWTIRMLSAATLADLFAS